MTFGAWLAAQAHRSGPIGDLTRDYLGSCGCGRGSCGRRRPYSVAGVRRDIDHHGGHPDALDALAQAAAEWQSGS
ncbi:hypothetical protein LDL08_38910 [Nonomuraea glycinis]|uniref:Uncharacterized protein n=1 Tax=Nonomuraea glycinis TaxID=2047744 RepID=A0A917ZZQ0_9ACTN|nr:hypothetical protein [Nonomuraea glycinis]MCA2182148.1 hypothetical protein [Nonomuraea glycinis]GGP02199.1 hypothetical protein GCM10012278_08480 [Nonomuraea glycinis]